MRFWYVLDSSNVYKVAANFDEEELYVIFHSNVENVYTYKNVSKEQLQRIFDVETASVGEIICRIIKALPFTKLPVSNNLPNAPKYSEKGFAERDRKAMEKKAL